MVVDADGLVDLLLELSPATDSVRRELTSDALGLQIGIRGGWCRPRTVPVSRERYLDISVGVSASEMARNAARSSPAFRA